MEKGPEVRGNVLVVERRARELTALVDRVRDSSFEPRVVATLEGLIPIAKETRAEVALVRSRAIEALGRLDPTGDALGVVAEAPLPLSDRACALEGMRAPERAASAALSLLPLAASAPDVVALCRAVVRSPEGRAVLVERLAEWQRAHPEQSSELPALLSGARSSELNELAYELNVY